VFSNLLELSLSLYLCVISGHFLLFSLTSKVYSLMFDSQNLLHPHRNIAISLPDIVPISCPPLTLSLSPVPACGRQGARGILAMVLKLMWHPLWCRPGQYLLGWYSRRWSPPQESHSPHRGGSWMIST
jgi:hypothetical protein